jgi:anti-sigma regulatory factor (Ser/Thr protein kinase)
MCDVTPDLVTMLPMSTDAPSLARELTRHARCLEHKAAISDVAQLLVSELVTNALKHGLPPIELRIRCRDDSILEVGVSDASPTPPMTKLTEDPEAEHGRGITLVDVLSDSWGVSPSEAGKRVWFRLSVDAA